MEALAFNGFSMIALFVIVMVLVMLGISRLETNRHFTDANSALWGIPLMACWIMGVMIRKRLWTSVDARKADVYLDYLRSKQITVYAQGFHFTHWTSRKQGDVIDFQKHEIITMKEEDGTMVRFPTIDGFEMAAELTIFFSLREGEEPMSRALKYEAGELKSFTKAAVIRRLTDLGGRNSYETMLYYKSDIATWLAKTFGGESVPSPFEKGLGLSIRNPILDDLDLTKESRETFGAKSKVAMLNEGIRDLKNKNGAGLDANEANLAAQAAQGLITREVHTFQGIENAGFVAIGESGIAAATNRQNSNNKKGNK